MSNLADAFRKPSYADLQQFEMQQQMEQYMQSMRENQRRESMYGDTGTIRMPTHEENVQEGFNKITGYSPEMNRAEKAALGAEWLMPFPAKGSSALFPALAGAIKGGMSNADKLVQRLMRMKDLSKSVPMDEASRLERLRQQGYTTETWHGSLKKNIDEFRTKSEIGLHSGDKAAAEDVMTSHFQSSGLPEAAGELYKLLIRAKNPYQAPSDVGRWDMPQVWGGKEGWAKDVSKNLPEKQRFKVNELARRFTRNEEEISKKYGADKTGIVDHADWEKYHRALKVNKHEFSGRLKNLLEKFGFDSIAYKNEVEGLANPNAIKSYISFKPQDVRQFRFAAGLNPKSRSSLAGIGAGALVAPALLDNERSR